MPAFVRWLIAFALIPALAGCTRSGPPFDPEDALHTFRIERGFRIETYITEPDIRSPVAMEIDENGAIYVVENPGYPLNVDGKVGRIIRLEDTDGNGRPDRRSVFADKLTLPTGVMRWKKGVLVTDAPDVLYFEDTDNDGTADIRKVMLTGFAFTNPQHTVNSPIYGLDNWIYLAHEGPATAIVFPKAFGDRGQNIRYPDRPDAGSLEPARRMIRFRPDTGQLEYLSTSSQFGHSFDSWGHHFSVSNEDHIRQEVLRARYLIRNPHLPVATAMERISDHRPAADVYPIAQNARVEMLSGVGAFTSACGITVYLGGAFPPALGLFSLVAEPAQSLVHRDVLSPSGATHVAKRAHEGVEFLASTDPWFRPVNFYIGPDGAVYLVDYYRFIVEHPEWTSTHIHSSPDLYKGDDRGRIYRISPESPLPLPGKIRLGLASSEQLVQLLTSANIWWRRTAQRLLIDRGSPDAVASLVRLFESSQSAVARLHALWTLNGLGRLEPQVIERALKDPEAGVRENAILLAEPHLPSRPETIERLFRMDRDPDPRVQFQLLLTLGNIDSSESRAVQQRLLAGRIEDPWMQIAALSASSERAPDLFRAAAAFTDKHTDARARLFHQIAAVIGARRQKDELRRVLLTLRNGSGNGASWWRVATLNGLVQGFGTSPRVPPSASNAGARADLGEGLLLALFEGSDAEVRRAALRVLAVTGLPPNAAPALRRAEATAQAGNNDPALRADSIGLVALGDAAAHEALFRTLLDVQQPEPVQAAAVRALGRVKGEAVGTYLIGRWKSMTPAVRIEAADAMFLDPQRPKQLLEAIRTNIVQPWTLQFRHRRQLLMNRDVALREAARAVLEEKEGARDEVLKRYQPAVEKSGNAQRGRVVYERVCAKCHKLNGLGQEMGPDLGTIRHRAPQIVLPDILMPSRSIAQNYESYVVETKSSGIVIGVLSSQTPTTITIRHEEGKEDVIRRQDISDIRITDLSAMPADLDKQITVDQMADLLSYLKAAQ